MIHRIIEAFTRPHYQITAIDELIQSATILAVIFVVVVIIAVVFRE